LQRVARGVAVPAVANQQQFEPPGPVGGRRVIDVFGGGIGGLPAFVVEAMKTVAADLVALEPAVARQPRHRRAHHAAADVEATEKFEPRADTDRNTARHAESSSAVPTQPDPPRGTTASPNTVMTMDPVREGSRLSWSTMRASGCDMPQRIARFADSRKRSTPALFLLSL